MTDQPWRTLRQILADPAALAAPQVIVPRFAWAGRTSLFAAREKDGKSTLAAAAAGAVTTGARFLAEDTTAGTVLWVAVEEHPHDLAQRAQEFGTDPDRLVVLGATDAPAATLRDAVAAVSPVLVVIDTLMTWASSFVDDPHSSAAWTPVMVAVTAVARESGAAVLLLHHARKSDGAYRDSSAIGAGVDVILEMSPNLEDAALRTLKARGRWPMQGFAVRYHGDGFELAAGELTLDARVLLHVEQHPGCSKRQIRDLVGGRAARVDATLETLLGRDAIRRGEDGLYTVSQSVSRGGGRDTPRDTGGVRTQVVAGQGPDTLWDTGRVPIPNPRDTDRDTPPLCAACGGPTEPGSEIYSEPLCNRCALARGTAEASGSVETG